MFCYVSNESDCVLLLFSVFVRCACDLLSDVVRFVVLLLVLAYLCVVLWFRIVFVCEFVSY